MISMMSTAEAGLGRSRPVHLAGYSGGGLPGLARHTRDTRQCLSRKVALQELIERL